MVSPLFKKATNTAPGTSAIYGAPDLKYVLDILDGTHATHRIQIQNIEGSGRSPFANWVIRMNGSTIEGIRTETGTVESSSTTNLNIVLNAILVHASFADGDVIVIKPSATAYTCGTGAGAGDIKVSFAKSCTIWAYGAILSYDAAHTGGTWFEVTTAAKRLTVYGLTMLGNNNVGTFIKSTAAIDIDGIRLYDVDMVGNYSYGVYVGGPTGTAPSQTPLPTTKVIMEHCSFFNSGSGVGAVNEWVAIDSIEYCYMKDCRIDNNKLFNISARHCNIQNIWCDTTGYSGGSGIGASTIQSEFLEVRDLHMIGIGVELRNYQNIDADSRYTTCKRMIVDGYSCIGSSGAPIIIEPYNTSTLRIENVSLRNLYLSNSGVMVRTFDSEARKSKVDIISIKDVKQLEFSSSNCCVNFSNCDCDQLVVDNVYFVASWDSTGAPVRAVSGAGTITLGKVDLRNLFPEPANYIFKATRSNAVTATFSRPLENGITATNTESGTDTLTVKFKENRGKATFNGGTASYDIAHSLTATPTSPVVTPSAAVANGAFYVTADATNITVTFSAALTSGTNNVILNWRASAN